MKTYKLMAAAAAITMALYSCSSIDDAAPEMPESIATNNTFYVSNGANLVIGNNGVSTGTLNTRAAFGYKTFGASDLTTNTACNVTMPEYSLADDAKLVKDIEGDNYGAYRWTGVDYPINYTESKTFGPGKNEALALKNDVYVTNGATLTLADGWNKVYGCKEGNKLVVAAGSKVSFEGSTILDNSQADIYNYGEIVVSSKYNINSGKTFMTANAASFEGINVDGTGYFGNGLTLTGEKDNGNSLSTTNGSKLYVKGNVTAAKDVEIQGDVCIDGDLTVEGKLTVGASGHLHVTGNVTVNGEEMHLNSGGQSETLIEGTVTVKNKLIVDDKAFLHSGCSIYADEMEIHNAAEVVADFISIKTTTTITSGLLELADNGVALLGDLNVADISDTHIVPTTGGKALIVTKNIIIGEVDGNSDYSLEAVVNENLYINYESITVTDGKTSTFYPADLDENCKVLIQNGDKVADGVRKDGMHYVYLGTKNLNVKTANTKEDGQCSPGFKDNSSKEDDPKKDDPKKDDPQPSTETDGDVVKVIIPTDIQRTWFLDADDFAIRTNGKYQDIPTPVGNEVTLNNVKVTEKDLTVTVTNVSKLDQEGTDYTYEVYLWIKPESWAKMSDTEKAKWTNIDADGDGKGQGTKIDDLCTVERPKGYSVRYNVYTGTSGNGGDTHYIKVSIHITKDAAKADDSSSTGE